MAEPDPTAASSSLWRRPIIAVLFFALLVRGGVLWIEFENLNDDPDHYLKFAENFVATFTYGYKLSEPSAYRPPVYPLLLTQCLRAGSELNLNVAVMIGMLHLLLGVITVGLVYRLGQKLELGRGSIVAALLIACDPILLHHSTLVMTETLATLLAVVVLLCCHRACEQPTLRNIAITGGVFALAGLCRPVFLVGCVIAGVVIAFRARGIGSKHFRRAAVENLQIGTRSVSEERNKNFALLAYASGYFFAAGLVLLPWMIRNTISLGSPIITTTHGGYTFALGNNPFFYDYLRYDDWGEVWDAEELEKGAWISDPTGVPSERRFEYGWSWDTLGSGDEVTFHVFLLHSNRSERQVDESYYRSAVQTILEQPGMFLYSCLVRVGRLWQLAPHRRSAEESFGQRALRYLIGFWYLVEFIFAALGVWVLGRRIWLSPWVWGVILCLSFTAVHTLYWSNMRMRAPLMPTVVLLAVAGGGWLIERRRERKSLHTSSLTQIH